MSHCHKCVCVVFFWGGVSTEVPNAMCFMDTKHMMWWGDPKKEAYKFKKISTVNKKTNPDPFTCQCCVRRTNFVYFQCEQSPSHQSCWTTSWGSRKPVCGQKREWDPIPIFWLFRQRWHIDNGVTPHWCIVGFLFGGWMRQTTKCPS